jgi:hypothetical protein
MFLVNGFSARLVTWLWVRFTRSLANKRLVKKIKVLSTRRTHMATQVSEKQHFVASRLGETSTVEHGSTVALFTKVNSASEL